MPEVCLQRYPVLGEMSYLKMLCAQMLVSFNEVCEAQGEFPVATGSMKKEVKNIKLACKAYHTSPSEMRMHRFVHAFNKLNNFSMAAYPVGMH